MTTLRRLLATLSTAAALAAPAALLLGPAPAAAAAPMARTPAPGYYRTMLGDFEVTALSDGTIALPMDKLLRHTTAAAVNKALARDFLANPVETSVNAYLVNTGTRLLLIDTGAAALFGPTLGRLIGHLKASGYQPEQVDEIYITHFHGDHVGGLVAGAAMAFPNAIVRADRRESDYWLSPANQAKAPADERDGFQGAMAALGPYVKAGRFKPFDGDTELAPGVRARAARGHTPGHATYVIESKGARLVLWGDLIHCASVQFDQPSVTIDFDSDGKAAAAARETAFLEAVRSGALVGAAHLPFPGLGHLRRNGAGYTFVPLNYGVPK